MHKIFYCSIIFLFLSGCSTTLIKQTEETQIVEKSNIQKRLPATHAWGPYHWARTVPQFTLKIGDNLTTSDWKLRLAQTSSDWNSPTQFGAATTPVLTAITLGTSNKRCSMVSGTTQVCNGKYGNNGWLGLASINIVNGEHITQGSAKMNDTYFLTAKYNNPNEKLHVICQEIAHTFGLGHQSESGVSLNSCMDYFSNTGVNATNTVSTRPNLHDFEMLNSIYEHLDNNTTVASATAGTSAANIEEDPNSWGQFMSELSQGRHSYYERNNADGSKTITHVYWTEERAAKCKNCDLRFDH